MSIARLWDRLRSSLWFRPAGWIIIFGALAFLFSAIDRQTGGVYGEAGLPWYFGGGQEGARTILSIIGGGMLTVTSLTFSIIMVAVVQTANAYSPRILTGYLGEPEHQHVPCILVGTFLYALLVLSEVRSVEDGSYVPTLSITLAIVLSLVSVGAFIFFIHYVSHSISVCNFVSLIMDETERTLAQLFPDEVGAPWEGNGEPSLPPDEGIPLVAEGSGYISYIDGDRLVKVAAEHDAVLALEKSIGDYVLHGVPLAKVWTSETLSDDLAASLHKAFHLGKERELRQDFLYGVRQLTDIALRALSPGINDPSTAEQCIDALVNLLAKLTRRTPISSYRCDEDGAVRVVARSMTLARVLDQSFSKIRYYADGDVDILLYLIAACGALGHATDNPSDRAALWSQVALVMREAERSVSEQTGRAALNKALWRAADVLEQDAAPLLLSNEDG